MYSFIFLAESNKSSLLVLETEIITADFVSTKLELGVSENLSFIDATSPSLTIAPSKLFFITIWFNSFA